MADTIIQQVEDYSYATRIDKWVAAGATSMVLRAPVKGMVGKTIEIDPLTNKERVVVSAVQDSTITFSPALTYAYQAGTIVRRILGADASGLVNEFIPIVSGWDVDSSAEVSREEFGAGGANPAIQGWPATEHQRLFHANWRVPENFKANLVMKGIGTTEALATGNIYIGWNVNGGAIGEAWNNWNVTEYDTVPVVGASMIQGLGSVSLTGAAAGDLVMIQISRIGGHPSDTCTVVVYISGIWITYEATD